MTPAPFPHRDDDIIIRQAQPADFDAIIARNEQAFSGVFSDTERERTRASFVFERFVVAIDGDDLIGLAGSFDFELTLPGGATVPTAGTTWVSVAPTHRRRGITRDMLTWVHDDASSRGLAAAELMASEGSIYERFGYGIATRSRSVVIDRRSATVRPDVIDAAAGAVRLVDAESSVDAMHDRYEGYRVGRVGEVSRTRQWIEDRLAEVKQPYLALHDDGYALWTVDADWGVDGAHHTLRIVDIVASSSEAHQALWSLVMSIDLVRWVKSGRHLSLDDPLSWMFTDPRAVATEALVDFLWVRPIRADALLRARSYRVSDELVIEMVDPATSNDPERRERWRLTGGPDAASCGTTDDAPDLEVTRSALGALVLGGVTATELAAGGRLHVMGPATLGRLDAFFGWAPLAHCTTDF